MPARAGRTLVLLFFTLIVARADAAVRPRYGADLTRGFVGVLTTVDPLGASSFIEREAARQVHAGLFRYDAAGEPTPDLVDRVEVIEGGLAVRLHLRESWFHDGSRVTAEDVRRSLTRFAGSRTVGALFRAGRAEQEEDEAKEPVPTFVRVAGPRELLLDVAGAPVLWPWLLADVGASVLPPDADGRVGAGPFRVAELAPDGDREVLRLVHYDEHHRGRPLANRLTYRRFPSIRALQFAHRRGRVDIVDLDAWGAELEGAVGATSELVVLRLNEHRLPSSAVRAALTRAIRRDALVDVVLGGQAEVASSLLRPRSLLVPAAADRGAADLAGDRGAADLAGDRGAADLAGDRGAADLAGDRGAADLAGDRGAADLAGDRGAADLAGDRGAAGVAGDPVAPRTELTLLYADDARMKKVAERLRVDFRAAGFKVRPSVVAAPRLGAALAAADYDLILAALQGGRPAVCQLAEVAGLLGVEPPPSLLRAAAAIDPSGSAGVDLRRAEAELLASRSLGVLYRRKRGLFVGESVRDARTDPGGVAVLENAWRWPLR